MIRQIYPNTRSARRLVGAVFEDVDLTVAQPRKFLVFGSQSELISDREMTGVGFAAI